MYRNTLNYYYDLKLIWKKLKFYIPISLPAYNQTAITLADNEMLITINKLRKKPRL